MCLRQIKPPDWKVPWGHEQDSSLLAGVHEHGVSNYTELKNNPQYNLGRLILPNDEKVGA